MSDEKTTDKNAMNLLRWFLDERTAKVEQDRCTCVLAMYAAYAEWSRANEIEATIAQGRFEHLMTKLGYRWVLPRTQGRAYIGLVIKPQMSSYTVT